MKLIWQNSNDLCMSLESLTDDYFRNHFASWPLLSELKRDWVFLTKTLLYCWIKMAQESLSGKTSGLQCLTSHYQNSANKTVKLKSPTSGFAKYGFANMVWVLLNMKIGPKCFLRSNLF